MSSGFEYDEEYERQKIELFRQEYIVSKTDLLRRIDNSVRLTRSQISRTSSDNYEQLHYLEAKYNNLAKFQRLVDSSPLFKHLEDWWCYEYSISSIGTVLFLRHVASADIDGFDPDADHQTGWLTIEEYDAKYKLIDCRCNYLTTEDFAAQRGVVANTIRVWIRRGKIRTATKIGNAWMIPELTPPFKRGFTNAEYMWDDYLNDIIPEYEEIIAPGTISIYKSQNNGSFIARYASQDNTERREYTLTVPELERLELSLISNPLVEFISDQEIIKQ